MSGKYRIIEKEYEDGHKEYTAQEAVTIFGFPIYWEKYVMCVDDYGFGSIRYICCGKTYEECLQKLNESLQAKEKERKKNKVKCKIYHKL